MGPIIPIMFLIIRINRMDLRKLSLLVYNFEHLNKDMGLELINLGIGKLLYIILIFIYRFFS